MAEPPRWVTVRAQHRTVTLDPPHLSPAENDDTRADRSQRRLDYAGILLTRLQGTVPEAEVWLPMGEHPSFADDEALINALHQALRWAGNPAIPRHRARQDGDDGAWLIEPC